MPSIFGASTEVEEDFHHGLDFAVFREPARPRQARSPSWDVQARVDFKGLLQIHERSMLTTDVRSRQSVTAWELSRQRRRSLRRHSRHCPTLANGRLRVKTKALHRGPPCQARKTVPRCTLGRFRFSRVLPVLHCIWRLARGRWISCSGGPSRDKLPFLGE